MPRWPSRRARAREIDRDVAPLADHFRRRDPDHRGRGRDVERRLVAGQTLWIAVACFDSVT